jgi:lysyl-tRNA synthetase class 2
MLNGRCIRVERSGKIWIQNEAGTHAAEVRGAPLPEPGDIVSVEGGRARVLTPNRSPSRSARWMSRALDPRRLKAIETRGRVESLIREFFRGQSFREVRTPLLVQCPGMETHIRPFRLESGAFLPTSPEFAMKKLLVGGLERIFQISSAFRAEPGSPIHSPEFTMLEWYRAYAGYEDIMRDTETLFAYVARELFGRESFAWQGREISVAPPWPRLRVRDLFTELVGVDLVAAASVEKLRAECTRLGLQSDGKDTWDDLYFRIWLNHIEPKLPADRAVFVTRYPASQAALSVKDRDPDGSLWAKRFEAYAGGIELANAFEELTDPAEQRRRFEEDMELRARLYGPSFPKNPLDEDFLQALDEGLPPSGGIALGVDRMVMLFADEPEIDRTLWLPSYSPPAD